MKLFCTSLKEHDCVRLTYFFPIHQQREHQCISFLSDAPVCSSDVDQLIGVTADESISINCRVSCYKRIENFCDKSCSRIEGKLYISVNIGRGNFIRMRMILIQNMINELSRIILSANCTKYVWCKHNMT